MVRQQKGLRGTDARFGGGWAKVRAPSQLDVEVPAKGQGGMGGGGVGGVGGGVEVNEASLVCPW